MFGSRNFLFAKASAIAAKFKLFTWGTNTNFGELGQGDLVNRSSPVQVGALVDWGTPAAGKYFSLCVKTNGSLWSWGRGTYGNLGLGNTTDFSSPVQVGALTSWEKPSAGTNSSSCIRTDGTLWAWGRNYSGQLGQNNTAYRSSPVQVGASTTWSANSVGQEFMLAVDNGKLFSWGSNDTGQLGLGDVADRSSPVQVGALTTWAIPAASTLGNGTFLQFSLCTKTDGTLWAWGENQYGQLGQNDTVDRSSPVQVGALTNWATPTVGGSHALCTKTDGTLWAWGLGTNGQLGVISTANRSSPVQIGGSTSWINPTAGTTFSLCTTINGEIWSWGNGGNGYLGLGNVTSYSSPKQIGSLTPWTKVSAGRRHVEALQGIETTAPVSLTVPVVTGTAIEGRTLVSTYGTWDNFPASFTFQWQRGVSNISGATSNNYLVDAADVGSTLRCVVTATNSFGSSSANSANTATVAAFTGGQLWTWGLNSSGQLGIGNTTVYSSPKQVGSNATWTKVFGGGYSTFAINAATELYAWGLQANNVYFGGPLGISAQSSRSSPVQVAGTGWANVASTGSGYSGASAFIKTNGTLWTTGYMASGQLGRPGAATNSPVQVGALTAWKEISATYNSFMSIKTDGTLWAWGNNNLGQLGLGNTTVYSSPVQVGALTNWKFISGSATNNSVGQRFQAVKTDGTLWGWGNNASGALGTGNSTDFSSPVQIGALTSWSNVNAGAGTGAGGGQTVARKIDGTLWVWGAGTDGALGLGTGNSYNSPVQLIGPNNWLNSIASVGFNQCTLVRSDGTLTTWGLNTPSGQLGLGDTVNRSSPVQIGSLNTWRTTKICPFGQSNAAIKIP